MGPTSAAIQWLLTLTAVLATFAVGYLVWRGRGSRFNSQRRPRRAGGAVAGILLVVLAQVSAVGAVAVNMNRSLGIFLDWNSVAVALGNGPSGLAATLGVGNDSSVQPISPAQKRLMKKQGWIPDATQPRRGHGTYRDYVVTGEKTGIRKHVIVWVPPGLSKRQDIAKLPVVMNLSGAYGSPSGYLHKSSFAEKATTLIRQKKIPPFLGIAPMVNVLMPHDTECTDYPGGGIRAFSWLADDVRTWAHRDLGVSLNRAKWTTEGVSLGGYCAAKLQAARPDAFSGAASVMGFFQPETDGTTLGLNQALQTMPALRQQTSVAWLVKNHAPAQQVRILALSSSSDPQSFPQFNAFKDQMRGRPGITFLDVPNLAHTNQSMGNVQSTTLPYLLNH